MGIQINVGDHVSPHLGFVTVPPKNRPMLIWARTRAKSIAKNMASADVYFRALPNGRSLTEILNDSAVWLSYSPSMTDYGATSVAHPKEVAIGPASFRFGRWTVLATLIHELAHVDGAPGDGDQRAERALLACGLGRGSEFTSGKNDPKTPYDPTIAG